MKIQINKILKYKYIGIVLIGIFCLLLPQFSYAVAVPVDYTSFWAYSKYFNRGSCGAGPWGDFEAYTNFYMSLSKQFDLSSTNLGGLSQSEGRVIRPGESITASNYDVTGSYSYSSADHGTPNMDNQINYWDYTSRVGDCGSVYDVKNQMRGGIYSQLGYTLSSSNSAVIDCSAGQSCTAKDQTGTATITVSFPGAGSYYVQRAYDFGKTYATTSAAPCTTTPGRQVCNRNGCTTPSTTTCTCPSGTQSEYTQNVCQGAPRNGQTCNLVTMCRTAATFNRLGGDTATGSWNFTLSSINYNLTVEVPNQPPTVSYTSTTDISYNTAKANWSYSDPEGDAQANYAVQVATDTGFGNIVFSQQLLGSTTNMVVSGLRPGTTYYPRVAVQDARGAWSAWVTGPAFTTVANNPPNLDQLSCNGESTGYTSGRVNWDYIGTDEPGDMLVFRLRYKKTTESVWTTVNLPTNRAGAQDIANLISGYGYNVEISLNDNRNAHLGDRWKGCGIFTTTEYPEPSVEFNLRSGSTTVAKGGTLTIKTGDPISTNWKITNPDGITPPDGLNPNSCALSNTGVRTIFNESGLGFGPDSRQNNNVAADTSDRTYTIKLTCTGKDARVPKSVNANITLVIQSYPLISCRIIKKVVSTESPTAQVEGTINNANPQYKWEIKRYAGDTYTTPITNGNAIQNFTLDYTGLEFGKYKPVIRAQGALARTSETECSENISNFGTRSFQEVAK
jgi:hypothetical protein